MILKCESMELSIIAYLSNKKPQFNSSQALFSTKFISTPMQKLANLFRNHGFKL